MAERVENFEPTRQSLLTRLKNWEDQASWEDFFNKYWRLIYVVARRSDLSDAEAQDVVQDSILALAKSMKTYRYQPERCPFRSWLLMLTRQCIIQHLRRQQAQPERRHSDPDASPELMASAEVADPAGSALEAIWDEEWRHNVIAAAREKVKKQVNARQFQIYDLHVLQNWEVKRVAATLDITTAQVYLAKHRVGRLMRKAVETIESRGE